MTKNQPTRYNFHSEQVHFARPFSDERQRFQCRRCERQMPMDSFLPLAGYGEAFGKSRRFGDVQALHPHCHNCRKQARGAWVNHKLYTPALDTYFQRLTSSATGSARQRGILFGVEKDDLLGLYLKQNGRCALSGLELDHTTRGGVGRGNRAKLAPSIDRIDCNGNYTLGNIQIVAGVMNMMKGELSSEQFYLLCEKVAAYRLEAQLME